jgi:hypothetical protein
MATIQSIEAQLQERAPFLTVKRTKHGFNIAIKDYPFLLVECQKFLGGKLSELSDEDINDAINEVIPTTEMVKKYRINLTNSHTVTCASMHKVYNARDWSSVSELASKLTGIEEQLKILEKAAQCAVEV